MDTLQFVQDLNIAYPAFKSGSKRIARRSALESGDDNKEQSFIADKGLVSFASGITGQKRQDVLNSTLLAQLAANYKYPAKNQLEKWYDEYSNVLSKLGWIIQGKSFSDYNSTHNLIEIENVVLEIIGASLGGNYMAIIQKTLDAFKELSKSKSNKIIAFEKNVHTLNEGTFQIGLADQKGDIVTLRLGAFIIRSKEVIKQILFFKGSSNKTDLRYLVLEGTLNMDTYDGIRQEILKKLGERVLQYVAEIEI